MSTNNWCYPLYFYIFGAVNSRWYILAFVSALALLGISFGNHNVPNQEIVIQFEKEGLNHFQTEEVLQNITKQLQSVGIEDIHVVEMGGGKLRVRYYSTTQISEIQHLFSNDKLFYFDAITKNESDSSGSSSENTSRVFHFNINEIQSNPTNDLGLNGVLLDNKFVNDPHVKPIFHLGDTGNKFIIPTNHLWKKQTSSYYQFDFISLKTYQIPEVRAGPIA